MITQAQLSKMKENAAKVAENPDLAMEIKPVVKIFNPVGAATWLFSEYHAEDDLLFGVVDLGFGEPELGYVSLTEIMSVRLPLPGVSLERDMHFTPTMSLLEYAKKARAERNLAAVC